MSATIEANRPDQITREQKLALARALQPITSRMRTDVTAVKANGKQAWTNEPLTEERLVKHVNGGPARGCCPIKEGEDVTLFAAFDLDSHKGEVSWPDMATVADNIVQAAAILGLEAIPFRSSGGNGIHLIFLWDDAQPAYSVRQCLKSILESVGLKDGAGGLIKKEVEVFPKQDQVAIGGRGNQIVLPLAGLSEPLIPFLGYEPAGKDYVLSMAWPVSEPVPVVERPARVQRAAVVSVEGLETILDALRGIPNTGADELDYDTWRNVIFALHDATGGSPEGLSLAHEFSAKSSKYDGDFLDNRVWPYIRGERDNVVPGEYIQTVATKFGWRENIDHLFEVLTPAVGGGGNGGDIGALPPDDDEWPNLARNGAGDILALLDNVIRAVRCFAMLGCRVAYDEFKDEVMVTTDRTGADGWRPLRDVDYVNFRRTLEIRGFKPISREMMRDVVLAVASENHFDSAILWAKKLKWDGVPRVERYFATHFGAEDTPYARVVALYMWTALAGRVLVPGIKADMSPVLIGHQGIRKSSGVAAMAPHVDAFLEIDFGDDDEKNARKLRGVLIAETGEMKGFQKKEQNHIKAFMSRQWEVWVPKYMERATRYARRCLFIGTSNDGEFLVDETGNRRWLPLDVTKVELELIERDRDQLWAEAVVLFEAKGVMWKEAEDLGKDKHAAHMISDEWENAIARWLDEPLDDGTTFGARHFNIGDVLAGALGIDIKHMDRKAEVRAGKALRKLGYDKHQTWHDGRNVKRWAKKGASLS